MIVILRLFIRRLTKNFLYLFFIVFIISCLPSVFKGKITSVGLNLSSIREIPISITKCREIGKLNPPAADDKRSVMRLKLQSEADRSLLAESMKLGYYKHSAVISVS
jgi:hypothetical protein